GANVQDLSGGQQQRVALARSLTVQPEVLLLDEPFSALDTVTRSALQRDIRRIAKDVGITLVTVTHDINEAILMADRVVVMASHPGRIVSEIPVDIDEYDRMSGSERMRAKRDELARLFGDAAGKQWHGSQEAELIPLAKAI
ncbi:MAG: ATP-binding cassette domain-containing protein, partial [Beijerinckiaceae bacterium]